MLLECTPGVLAKHLLEVIAVSDRVSLQELWKRAKNKLTTETVDEFQKNVIWRALAAQGADVLFMVHIDTQLVTTAAHLSYGTLLLHGTEEDIWIVPTDKCKYLYLTGTANYHKIITALGEKPVELLGVIARHGLDGVINSVLAQESNQDIRSIGVRLQKLEAAGLIICQSVYLDQKHTNQSTHVRFVADSLVAKQNADVEEDIRVTRDAKRLKVMILEALKLSSNHIRGYSDLRKDLKLESVSEVKFYKSVCNRLHYGGYIEKLQVELPQTKQRVYAIRFVKDINLTDELNDVGDVTLDIKDEFSEDDAEPSAEGSESIELPSFNQFFTPFHQMFLQILARGESGVTIGEITKHMLGTSDFRPYNRVFEQLPTYLSNSKTLKTFKKYAEPYDDFSATKLYDHEGKVKFYRYFVTDVCKESRPKPKNFSLAPRSNKMSLGDWEKKLAKSLGKISTESLLKKKERLLNPSDLPAPLPSKKRERAVKVDKDEEKEKLDTLELAQMAIEEQGSRPKRARRAVSYSLQEVNLNEEDNKDEVFNPDEHMEEDSADDENPDDENEEDALVERALRLKSEVADDVKIAPDLLEHDMNQRTDRGGRRVVRGANTPRTPSSLSTQKRRDELLKILAEEGGAAVVSGILIRCLDQRLDKTTETDKKTIMRDVSALVKDGVLETRDEQIGPEGRQIKRTLLILTSHREELTDERMQELHARFFQESLKREVHNKRLIEAEINFVVEKPKELADIELTTKRRERVESRLREHDNIDSAATVKPEPHSGRLEIAPNDEEVDENVFETIKSKRKARKVPPLLNSANTSILGIKRPRRSLKLEKEQATMIYRLVIIHRAFSKEAIDFGAVARLIGETDLELVRRKWSTLRRLFGGAEAITKGVETFQNMVIQGIDEGSISVDDLLHYNSEFFLRFWKKFDVNAELTISDRMPLLATYALNETRYDMSSSLEHTGTDLAEKIEETSMRQKEGILANIVFTCAPPEACKPKDHEELRSVLKSILSIDENELNSTAAKDLLKAYSADEIQSAADSMIRDREILLVSLNERKKFLLSERFHTTLTSRVFTERFFHDAELFRALVDDTTSANKGLVVSPGILSGEMAALLQRISDNSAQLIRVDRALKFENYESRLIDREQIACDIIVHGTTPNDGNEARNSKDTPNGGSVTSPVPLLGACKPVWINLKTEVNAELWRKVVMIVLYHVVFKPGIPRAVLGTKLQVLLNNTDFDLALEWLVKNHCLVECDGALMATNSWQYILGK